MTNRERLDAIVNGELPDRVLVHDVACITVAKAMGYEWKDARYDAKLSAKLTNEFNKLTGSDFEFAPLETPAMFMDLGVEVSQPDDNYGNVLSIYFSEPEDIDTKELYDPYNPNESKMMRKGIVDKIMEYRKVNDTGALTSGWSWGIITTAGFLRGVETLLMDTMLEPELAHKAIKKASALVDGIMRVGSEGGDYIWVPDPTASGTVINIDTFKEFDLPYTKEVVSGWKKDLGLPVIYHVCGDTIPIMDAIPETGVDVLSADHAIDLAEARAILGDRLCLMGNVHPIDILWNGTPESVRDASMECIAKAGTEGRFILSGGCEVPRDTPISNIKVMADTAKAYRY
jgi:uroporphyrinogen decarboxylase